MLRTILAASALALLTAAPAAAAPPPAQTLQAAGEVLDTLSAIPAKGIPPALLADAQGVAVIPRVIKAGFVVGGRGGHGVVLARDRSGAWGPPTFVNIGGASVGFQVGVQATDLVLVFKSRDSLDRILAGRGKVTLGADVSVAAGPVGRQAEAATDARLQAEIVSYSRSRGLFAGVALDGAALVNDANVNAQYRQETRPEVTQLAAALQARLTAMSGVAPAAGPLLVPVPPGR